MNSNKPENPKRLFQFKLFGNFEPRIENRYFFIVFILLFSFAVIYILSFYFSAT